MFFNKINSVANMTENGNIEFLSHVSSKVSELSQLDLLLVLSTFGIIFICYWFVEMFLSSNKKFAELPFDRKRYVIKNLIKAVYLYLLTVFASISVKNMLLYDIWNNNQIKVLGLMYCLPDFISLFRVPNMAKATVQHHVTTTLLATLNLFNDYSQDTHWRGMIIYAYLSMLTGIVNFYLGYRLIHQENNLDFKTRLAKASFVIYAISLILNWTYQVYIISRWLTVFPLIGLYAYILLIGFVVYDDIILVSFLYHEFSKNHTDTPQKTPQPPTSQTTSQLLETASTKSDTSQLTEINNKSPTQSPTQLPTVSPNQSPTQSPTQLQASTLATSLSPSKSDLIRKLVFKPEV
jgi:hypothetical protein